MTACSLFLFMTFTNFTFRFKFSIFWFIFLAAVNKLNNPIATWDTKVESGIKTALLQPFSPIVVAADDSERIR